MQNFRFDQVKLIAAITAELSRQQPGLPADDRINTVIKAANMICDEYERKLVPATSGMGLPAWLASDDVGLSSRFMASVLSGQFVAENNYPRDPDDLGRCIRLVDAVPEFKTRISLMSAHGHEWQAVAINWDNWSQMYHEDDDDQLYSAMQNAYAKAGAQ